MITVINGPWCPLCDSRDVRFEWERRPVAWASDGVRYAQVKVGYCNICDPPDRFEKMAQQIVQECLRP